MLDRLAQLIKRHLLNMNLCHKDTITIYEVGSSEYGNDKSIVDQHTMKATFIQSTGYGHNANQDFVNSDAIVFPDERDSWVIESAYRLEGMYVKASVGGGDQNQNWYKITKVTVSRSHLLNNRIDNVQCALKKTESIADVS